MLRTLVISLLALCLLVVPRLADDARAGDAEDGGQGNPGPSNWIADYDEGVRIAQREGKDLFVDFTGSDWCTWCKKLDAEVLEKLEFMQALEKHFVLVALDYPRNPAAQARIPNPKRNGELQSRFAITEFPVVMLMTSKGDAYARTGYREGGWKPYLAHINELRKRNRKQMRAALELAGAINASKGATRTTLVRDAVQQLAAFPVDAPYVDVLVPAAREAAGLNGELDAAAQTLRNDALRALLRVGKSNPTEEALAAKTDPKNEHGLLELTVDAQCRRSNSADSVKAALVAIAKTEKLGVRDKHVAARLFVNAAHWQDGVYGDVTAAKAWAQKAHDLVGTQPQFAELFKKLGVPARPK